MRAIGYHQKDKWLNNWDSRRKKSRRGEENLTEEITAENFPNMGKDLDIQVHEANITHLHYFNAKRPSARYFVI